MLHVKPLLVAGSDALGGFVLLFWFLFDALVAAGLGAFAFLLPRVKSRSPPNSKMAAIPAKYSIFFGMRTVF